MYPLPHTYQRTKRPDSPGVATVAHIEAALVETPVEIVRSRASSGKRDRTKRLHRQHS